MSGPRQAPRYTGVRTFAGLEHFPLGQLSGAEARPRAVVVGIPFDTATSYRAGARFGPQEIRSLSALLRPWHPLHKVRVFDSQEVIDGGDVAVTPGNAERTSEQIARALAPASQAQIKTVVLGGDHSITLGQLRAHHGVHGPLALVLLDAHADSWEDYYGERLFHGTVLRRACEEGLIDPSRSILAGIRGPLYAPEDLSQARDLGLQLLTIEELRAISPHAFAERVRARVRSAPAFLGLDIDVIDPSAAPATGTPEVGGLAAHEALTLLRALTAIDFVGFDVVEVSPPYDSPGQITALLAANIAYEMLALTALAGERQANR